MDGFSGALKLVGLDDFITPSQDCVMPIQVLDKKKKEAQKIQRSDDSEPDLKRAKISVEQDEGSSFVELNPTLSSSSASSTDLGTAKISLQDCLACSGCITSAESVLITAQSKEEFFSKLASKSKDTIVVISISPQSRASIAAKFNLSSKETALRLITFFKKTLGVDYVFDTTFSREFSLLESMYEFVNRFRESNKIENSNSNATPLPMLASACPGWVCYAEKTHGDYVLPYISTAKSPQQVMGSLVKSYFGQHVLSADNKKTANQIYHVSVMPCFDKKLEASRDDFYNDVYRTRDVDCVLTSGEILEIIQSLNVDFQKLEEDLSGFDQFFQVANQGISSLDMMGTKGSGSGGYLECIFKFAAKELFGKDVEKIEYKTGRNSDTKTVSLEVEDPVTGQKKVVLQFAAMYGFRNIQNLVRMIKRNNCNYHFVEVMACPSGCLNGGGQIKPEKDLKTNVPLETSKQLVERLEKLYHEPGTKYIHPEEDQALKALYASWIKDEPGSESAKQVLHTQYHEREKLTNALAIKW